MPANCAAPPTGFLPFVDATISDAYQTYELTLYPGSNSIPAGHATQLATAAAAVVKRNSAGTEDPAGKIVVLSISMSNGRQEWESFTREASDRGQHVVLVNGAQTGKDAAYMYSNIADYWTTVDTRLAAKSVTAAQVGAIWLKQSIAGETGSFPAWAQTLETYLKYIVEQCAIKFPNAKIIFCSSRTYGGYATTGSPEPWAYESGFAVKWLIERQIAATDIDLEYGTVPTMTWGPYLWADGTAGRDFDDLIWNCLDFEDDGYHPAGTFDDIDPPDGAEYKVAILLRDFFQTNIYTAGWWYGIGPTLHTTLASGTTASSYATSSYTPTDGILQVVFVLTRLGSQPNQPTATGHGLTYVVPTGGTRVFGTEAAPTSRLTVFVAPSSSPSAGGLTVDFGGQNQLVCLIASLEISGIYNHANGVVQVKVNSADAVANLTVTLDAETIEAGILAAFGNAIDSRMTPDTGWDELVDFGNGSPALGVHVQFLEGYDGTVFSQKSGAGTMNYAGIALGLRQPPPDYLLEVTLSGNGALTEDAIGTVTSSPSGIGVGDLEEEFTEDTLVTLTAVAAAGWTFVGWDGDHDSEVGAVATVTMDAAKQITAEFVVTQAVPVTLRSRSLSVTLHDR